MHSDKPRTHVDKATIVLVIEWRIFSIEHVIRHVIHKIL